MHCDCLCFSLTSFDSNINLRLFRGVLLSNVRDGRIGHKRRTIVDAVSHGIYSHRQKTTLERANAITITGVSHSSARVRTLQ